MRRHPPDAAGFALSAVPTVELHRHFEAGIRPEAIARLAERHGVTEVRTRAGALIEGVDPQDPESIRGYYRRVAEGFRAPDGFMRFVDSFGLPLAVLCTLEDLEAAVFDQLVHCASAGSLHTELRGSPLTYADRVAAPLDEIAGALIRGVDRAWRERQVSGTFVLAFSRQKGLGDPAGPPRQHQAPVIAALAARLHRPGFPVGLDIAGFPEREWPPGMFEEALRPAREAGVPLTVHSGEQARPPAFDASPPSLVVEAVERLGAKRIGHGTSLAASAEVRALLVREGIGVECCPWSNHCMGFMPIEQHPLGRFLADGLLASVSTDDPLMFGRFTVAETLDLVAAPLALDVAACLRLTRNAIDTAFVTDARRAWLYEELARRLASGLPRISGPEDVRALPKAPPDPVSGA